MTYVEKYINASNRGEFVYEVREETDTGGVFLEECKYKDRWRASIRNYGQEFVAEINLDNEPFLIEATRSCRKRAREFVERVLKNDFENNGKNMKYI